MASQVPEHIVLNEVQQIIAARESTEEKIAALIRQCQERRDEVVRQSSAELAALDEALATLQGAVAPAKKQGGRLTAKQPPLPFPSGNGNGSHTSYVPLWRRIQQTMPAGSQQTLSALALAFGSSNAAVNAAVRSQPTVFRVVKTPRGLAAILL